MRRAPTGRTRRDWSIIELRRTEVAPWWRVRWTPMGRRPWPQMLGRFNDLRDRFWGCPAAHDATGMRGAMADDFLRLDAGWP